MDSALKERNSIAQRNALGPESMLWQALQGRNIEMTPIQGWQLFCAFPSALRGAIEFRPVGAEVRHRTNCADTKGAYRGRSYSAPLELVIENS
jgi:hypothetical protein